MSLVEVRHDGAVAILTLDRPAELNAFTVELHAELAAALKAAAAPDIRAVVVTGRGRAFCAGQDLGEVLEQDLAGDERLDRYYNPNVRALRALEKPVLAAVNGAAAGAGLSLALACDIRLASDKASFTPAFSAIGLIPDSGASFLAVEALGYSRAFEWMASSRRLSAVEALEWGLVSAVTTPEGLMETAVELAGKLAAMPGNGVAMTKRLMQLATRRAFDQQLEFERQLQGAAMQHPDYTAQVEAFLARAR